MMASVISTSAGDSGSSMGGFGLSSCALSTSTVGVA